MGTASSSTAEAGGDYQPAPPARPPVKRVNLGFIGVDLVVLDTPELIATALSSGDLKRLQDISPNDISELPWFTQGFLSTSRFYRPPKPGSGCPGQFFTPLRSRDSPSYPACRRYLEGKFATRVSWGDLAVQVAEKIVDPAAINDRAVADLCACALWRQIVPEGHAAPPKDVLLAASQQVMYLPDSFNPFTMATAKLATAKVYDYAEETLRGLGEYDTSQVPPDSAVDIAHIMFAMHAFGPPYLRELAAHPFDDQAAIFSRVGLTKDVARMTLRESTLGGLLSADAPAYAKRTLVLLKIRSAAQQSGDTMYAFSGGPGEERCCAEPVYGAFFKDVQQHLQTITSCERPGAAAAAATKQ